MKKFICILTVLTGSEMAFAKMALDLRADYRSRPSYKYISNVDGSAAAANAETKEEALFIMSRARMKVEGELLPGVNAYTRFNLNADGADNDKGGPTNLVEYAFITHEVNPTLAITAGKLAALVGGHEGDYNWADIYFATHTGNQQNGFFTGFSLDLKPAEDQMISLVVGNNEDGTADDQKKTGSGIYYRGGVMDNKIGIAAHFHQTYKGAQGAEKTITYSGFGLKFSNIENLVVDLEYLGATNETEGVTSTGKVKDSTVYSQARYFFTNSLAGVGKVESSQHKDEGTDTKSFDRTRGGLALEFYPKPENQNFRYHIAYDSWTDKFKEKTGGEDSVTASELFVGMRLYTDIAGK